MTMLPLGQPKNNALLLFAHTDPSVRAKEILVLFYYQRSMPQGYQNNE